jgi:hypothetical protein
MLGSWNGKDKTKDQMYIQDKLNSLVDGKPDELMHAEQLHASASLHAALEAFDLWLPCEMLDRYCCLSDIPGAWNPCRSKITYLHN